MREGSSNLRLRGERTKQKSSLGQGQYRVRKYKRCHHLEAREAEAGEEEEEEDGQGRTGQCH